MLEFVLNLFFPNVCGICEKICKDSICFDCNEVLKKLYIQKIIKNKCYYDKHLYIFKYEGIIRKKILDYKFNEKSYLYKFFAKTILETEKKCRFLEKYDIIIPVPIHKNKELKRGYNQCTLIAKEISKSIPNLVYCKDLMIKKIDTVPQSKLNKTKRMENVKNVYEVKNLQHIKNKKIIILDDIYTTGSTVLECSKILKQAGAKEIGVITIAKD